MYPDNSLLPSEAVRLLALGLLADESKRYGQLAREIRHFTGRIVGPSLDLVGVPLELLKVEGLVVEDSEIHPQDSSTDEGGELSITKAGRQELRRLLTSASRAPANEINKMIIAIKIRFLHLLSPEERALQLEILIEMNEREVTRLQDLSKHHADQAGYLAGWLERETRQAQERLDWYRELLQSE